MFFASAREGHFLSVLSYVHIDGRNPTAALIAIVRLLNIQMIQLNFDFFKSFPPGWFIDNSDPDSGRREFDTIYDVHHMDFLRLYHDHNHFHTEDKTQRSQAFQSKIHLNLNR